jgi:CBS domain containing-hemolysin-like protein
MILLRKSNAIGVILKSFAHGNTCQRIGAWATQKLVHSPTQVVATIQIGSTLIGILSSALNSSALSGAALVDHVDLIVPQVG